ncbi:hypothetical protein OJF2_62480 [Aquisphaera giovannonii]|uniref:Carboxypeptidase regulatory-like domain-containing protein n=1 Tax=Aquisphaera giovannonii TaxID=406548 RepID=A0A5B9WB02_9BACT|nr:hypothetical protein [Aquisphaera giovannonii]QEH37657.1 hypothetical protein OJF2_62480 [Aquisphaera giovannonii]
MGSLISMTKMLVAVAVGCSALCVLTAAGVILPPAEETRIQGRLTVNGQPVKQTTIVFSPRNMPLGEGWGAGHTDLAGEFHLISGGVEQGLKPGAYTVHLIRENAALSSDQDADAQIRRQIPPQFFEATTTDIVVQVDGGASCRMDINLPAGPGMRVASK